MESNTELKIDAANESNALIVNPPPDEKSIDKIETGETVSVDPSADAETLDNTVNSIESETGVNDESYAFVDFLEFDFTEDLKEFYKHYILETPDGVIQVFQSLTYGEMLISFLLLFLIVLYLLRWIFDVLYR